MDPVRKLRKYARGRGVKIYIRKRFPLGSLFLNGSYNIPNRIVSASQHLKKKRNRLICTLAHELGHSVDFDRMGKRTRHRIQQCVGIFVMWSIGELSIPKVHLRRLRRIIIDMETRAYDEGDKILRKLKIEVPPNVLRNSRESSLRSYRRFFSEYLP